MFQIQQEMIRHILFPTKIAARGADINPGEWAIRRSLKRIGLEAEERKRKPALSNKNIVLRKKFVDTYKEWIIGDGKRVMWSDETKLNRSQSTTVIASSVK